MQMCGMFLTNVFYNGNAIFIRFENARFVVCTRAKIQEDSFQSVALQWEVRKSQELTIVFQQFRRLRDAETPTGFTQTQTQMFNRFRFERLWL